MKFLIQKEAYKPQLRDDTLLFVNELKVWFPIRRGVKDILLGKSRKFVKAVDGVSFDIKEGEVLALAGESGCGKTTTGRTIVRLIDPTSGIIGFKPSKDTITELLSRENESILLDTKEHVDITKISYKNLKLLRREMQIVFQDPFASLNSRKSILKILLEPLEIHNIGESKEERINLVAKALELVKLTPAEEFMFRYPHQLSGGQRQRVVIARAIILKPRFIVADEPVSMLDVSIRAEIIKLLLDLKQELKLSYLFITHDLALTRYFANKIAVMYLGKIIEIGPVDKVLSNPLHPYTKALIKAIPVPNPDKRKEIKPIEIIGEVPSAIDIPHGCRFHPRCPMSNTYKSFSEKCTRLEPELIEIENEHFVSCWLYHD